MLRAGVSLPRYRRLLRFGALASLLVVGIGGTGLADNGKRGEANADRALRLLSLTPVPVSSLNTTAGAMYSFDISFVDQKSQTYYLADRSNKAVDVVDAKTGKFITQIFANFNGFTPCPFPAGANDCAGPDGVVAAFPFLFVTDAKSRVVSFDLRTNPPSIISDVTTAPGDARRADELAFDPDHGTLLVINNADTPPFGTLIKVDKTTGKLTVGQRVTFDAAHGVDAQNGAEQPIYDPFFGRFFLSIPQIGSDPATGGVIRINPNSATVEAVLPVKFCSPAGLALGPQQRVLIGCNTVFDTEGNVWDPTKAFPAAARDVILNLKTGKVEADVIGVGAGDEVWFNHGDNNFYATGSGSPQRPLPAATAEGSTPAGVIDAKDQKLEELFPTINVPAGTGHPAGTSHSIAANQHNNLVFVPLPANNLIISPDGLTNCTKGCIAIFGHTDEAPE